MTTRASCLATFSPRSATTAPQSLSAVVGVVVVTYNSAADIARCLNSLAELCYKGGGTGETPPSWSGPTARRSHGREETRGPAAASFFVIVVDNASTDNTRELLIELQETLAPRLDIYLQFSPENRGFAAGNNQGIAGALARGAEFVWLLNADTTVERDALSNLIKGLEGNPRCAAVGSKILYPPEPEAPRRIWSCGAYLDNKTRTTRMYGHGQLDSQCGVEMKNARCDYLPGCSLLFRGSIVSEVGYLPERYFMYFEETDWCARLRSQGYQLNCIEASIVYHHFADTKLQAPFAVYYQNRNARVFWFLQGTLLEKVKLLGKTTLVDLPRSLRAYIAAPNVELREIFGAHVWSCLDFLCWRLGRRARVSP